MAVQTSPPEATPTKFSRYRSVRRAQAQQTPALQSFEALQQTPPVPTIPLAPAMEQEPLKDAMISRSMSRYHRRPMTAHAKVAPSGRSHTVDVPPPLPTLPQASSSSTVARSRAVSSPQTLRDSNNVQSRPPNTSKSQSEAAVSGTRNTRESSDVALAQAQAQAKQALHDETERQSHMQETIKADKAQRRAQLEAQEAEHARKQEHLRREADEVERRLRAQREVQRQAEDAELLLRRKKSDQEHGKRLQKAESAKMLQHREEDEHKARYEQAARNAQASPPLLSPKHGGGFGLFRRRKEDAPVSPPANTTRPPAENRNRDLDTIKAGGGGAVLGIDAPISAVNAGDRRVMVSCNDSNILLPVTPTTTPLMLVKSAATCLTERIDVRTAVVLESFSKVGLQRPLRNYEHVRDVMNSWDDDKQNDLVIVDSVAGNISQQELLASNAPNVKPESMGCYIHYSSKPGKWSKRYITLRSDGQLVMSKSEGSKEKDQENLCHLSDFDIYTPTSRKLTKVKPPKKMCYAVKSQQKSTMFMDESRFVHFFCTNDRNTASLFYKTLHTWRSWYLKNVMGEGRAQFKKAEIKPANVHSSSRNVSSGTEHGDAAAYHARNASVGSHYQLGTFQPLLDFSELTAEPKEEEEWRQPGAFPDHQGLGKAAARATHARKMSIRAKGPPPVYYNLVKDIPDNPTPQDTNRQNSLTRSATSQEGDTFAPTGLLGRNYSQRQRTVQEREKKSTEAFVEGPSLLNNMNLNGQLAVNETSLGRQTSVRSNFHRRTSSDIQRSASTRAKPKPLIDLTPQYREPPQHRNKGKGFVPEGGAGPLVENATCITLVEDAIKVPPSTDWRARPSTARPNHGTYGTGGHERTRSLKGRGEALALYAVNNHAGAPEDHSNAFTGGGLVARAGFQGPALVGHGVMDGSKANGPMINLMESSEFPQGSLLATVAKVQGPSVPVIDREK
ncbi:hypothetical protein K504DRAFT_444494 [Pleomassaria siparia CBS 279.74]|uniref:PH domain-containing protein n=1 Tax=Pleomassaria siparia CBS 279.74 TaxID=1314801 RepID=A0A6G1JRT8_9PLEO|nr:hypothetical protein K504DRAFT_444494 [Pleomassaria siparia CBS 279.74]